MDSAAPFWKRLSLWLTLGGMCAVASPLIAGKVYRHTDLQYFYLPLVEFYARQLHAGGAFAWHPDLFDGFYLHGEGQLGLYHPWHFFLYRFFDLGSAFAIQQFAPFAFGWLGMRLWLRRWMSAPAAEVASAYFVFSTFFVRRMVHLNALEIVAHAPWMLWMADSLARRPSFGRVAGFAALIGSQLLLGYPQYAMLTVAGAGLWAAATWTTTDGRRFIAAGVASVGLGVALGAVQLWPTVEALGDSTRDSATLAYRSTYSIHPLNLLQAFSGTAFAREYYAVDEHANGHETCFYPSAAATLLALWILAGGGRNADRRFVLGAGILVVVGAILALGKYAGVYSLLANLPVIGGFRAPCRYLLWTFLGLAGLVGISFDALLAQAALRPQSEPTNSRPWAIVVGIAVAAFAGLSAYTTFGLPSDVASASPILGLSIFACALVAVELARRGSRPMTWLLAIFALVDSLAYSLPYLKTPGDEPRTIAEIRAGAYAPEGTPHGRLVGDIGNNAFLLQGWRSATGYVGLPPKQALNYRESPTARRLANVTHVWKEKESRWESMSPRTDFPEYYLAARVFVAADPAVALERVDPRITPVVSEPVDVASATVGKLESIERVPGRWRFRVTAAEPQLLVVGESFHRGWQGTVAGSYTRVVRTNGDFMGMRIPAGTSDVELQFAPASLRRGAWLSLTGLAVAALLIVAEFRRRPQIASLR